MNSFFKPGDYIDYTNAGSAIAAGDVVQIGDVLGIAVNDIAASTGVGPVLIRGIVKVTKTGSQAWTQGQTVFYSGSNTFTTVATSNARAGVAAFAVGDGAGETTGYVLLNTTPGLDIGEIQSHIADPASAAAMTQDTLTDSTTGVAATTLAAQAVVTTHNITDSSTGAVSTGAIAAMTSSANAGSADIGPAKDAIATLAAELALTKADLATCRTEVKTYVASIAAQLAKIKTDVAAVRTGSEANNTAIDSINAALAAFKVTAAS